MSGRSFSCVALYLILQGIAPSARRDHAAVLLAGKIPLFTLTAALLSSRQTEVLCCLILQGIAPSARRDHAAVLVAGRQLLLCGGWDGETSLADVAVLDTQSWVWQQVAVKGEGLGGGSVG